jgi:hypothetical protein
VTAHNEQMVLVEAAFVFGMVALTYYAILRLLPALTRQRQAAGPARWVATHHDVKGVTRVVLEKVSTQGSRVLDEHLISTIPIGDPEYDAKFLTAMAAARDRRALFEAEEE